MLLSQSLLTALDGENISGVNVYCSKTISEEVSKKFLDEYSSRWNAAIQKAEVQYGTCKSDIPISIEDKNYGFFIAISELEIRYCDGDYYIPDIGVDVFLDAIKSMKSKYPQIEYEGYVGYILSDVREGYPFQFDISSSKDKNGPYDFIGETLNHILAAETYAPEEPFDANNFTFAVTEQLNLFDNKIKLVEYIKKLGGKFSESLSKNTSYLISGVPDADLPENIKAKNLGVTVISEAEFVGRFGECDDLYEYNLSWEFYETLAGELLSNNDYDKVIDDIKSYSKWIKKSDIDKAIRAINDIRNSFDEDFDEDYDEDFF